MPLTFRLHSTRDGRSYTVRSGGWIVGSIDELVEGPSKGGWKYQIKVGGPPDFVGTGIADTVDDVKEKFCAAWLRWLIWAALREAEDQ